MADLLAALRREHEELTCRAAECRDDSDLLPAVIAEEMAARLELRIAELEAREEVAA